MDNSNIYITDNEFAEWAFGKRVWNAFLVFDCDIYNLMNAWNERHGDKLLLVDQGCIHDDMTKMKELWLKTKPLST